MHGDLCLSFPVGDILSESRGNLPILQRGTAEKKKRKRKKKEVQQLYTWRDSQYCWEEKQRRLNAASVKNMHTNYLLAHTIIQHRLPHQQNKYKANTKENLCYHHLNRRWHNIQFSVVAHLEHTLSVQHAAFILTPAFDLFTTADE